MTEKHDKDVIFYDGECGFCHRWVKVVLKKDHSENFLLAPRESAFFEDTIDPDVQKLLPRSILVYRRDKSFLTHSDATLYIMTHLGSVFNLTASVGRWVPKFLRDFGYGCVSKIRNKIYPKPEGLCPIVPDKYRSRFRH